MFRGEWKTSQHPVSGEPAPLSLILTQMSTQKGTLLLQTSDLRAVWLADVKSGPKWSLSLQRIKLTVKPSNRQWRKPSRIQEVAKTIQKLSIINHPKAQICLRTPLAPSMAFAPKHNHVVNQLESKTPRILVTFFVAFGFFQQKKLISALVYLPFGGGQLLELLAFGAWAFLTYCIGFISQWFKTALTDSVIKAHPRHAAAIRWRDMFFRASRE